MIDKLEEFCLNILRKIKLGKVADLYMQHQEGMRYLVFGALSTVVNIVTAAFTYYVMFSSITENIRVNLSTIISIIAAWIFAYVTNKLYVFDSKTETIKELLKEIASFAGCRTVTAIVEIVIMNVCVTRLHWNYMLMKIIANIIVILLNFVFSKLIIFKNDDNKKEKISNDKVGIVEKIYQLRFLITLIVFVVCVVLKISGSSIGMWQKFVNADFDDTPYVLFGQSRTIRSDEYAVLTPMFFSQVSDGFHWFSNLLRGGNTDVFMVYGLPVKNVMQIFRPFEIGFLFLGMEKGLSFFWCGRWIALFLVTFEFGMLITKKNKLLSLVAAFMVTLAPQIQWWFAVNGAVELFVFGELAVVLLDYYMKSDSLKKRSLYLLGMVICAGGYILILYPAWQIPLAYVFFALAVWVIVENRKQCKIGRMDIISILIAIAVFGCSMLYILHQSHDTIKAVTGTVYPGARVGIGGYAKERIFNFGMNVFLPYYDNDVEINQSEIASMFGVFPIGIIISIIAMCRNKKIDWLTIFLGIIYVFLGCYCIFGFPEWLAKITLMSNTVVERELIAIGFLDILLLLRGMTITEKTNRIWIAGIIAIICSSWVSRQCYLNNKVYVSEQMAIGIFVYLMFLCYFVLRYHSSKICKVLFSIEIIVIMLFSGGYVNPIRRGTRIIYDSPIIQGIQAIQSQDEGQWLVNDLGFPIPNYVLMAGVPVVNSTNTYPALDKWRMFDPEHKYEDVYNRYAHISIKIWNSDEDYKDKFELIKLDYFSVNLVPEELKKLNIKYVFSVDAIDKYNTEHINFVQLFSHNGFSIYKVIEK